VKRRFIAAVVLLNLVSWANSAAFCLSGLGVMAAHIAPATHASQAPRHSCCPHVQAKAASDTWTPSQACEYGHRCCFVQNPQIPSNLPESPGPAGQVASVAHGPNAMTAAVATPSTPKVKVARSYFEFCTVLRI